MIHRTTEIHGLGPAEQAKLASLGILTSEHLKARCGNRYSREELRHRTGIPEDLLERWTIQAELMRIPSVGPKGAYLLERCGVRGSADLESRDGAELLQALEAKNDEERILDTAPTRERIECWIQGAAELSPLLVTQGACRSTG